MQLAGLREVKLWQKIGAVCLAFGIPIVILLYLYINEQNKPIDFAQKELFGTAYLRPCRDAMEHVLQHRRIARRVLQGDESLKGELSAKASAVSKDIEELNKVDAKYGKVLSEDESKATADEKSLVRTTDKLLSDFRAKWSEITQTDPNRKPSDSDKLHQEAIQKLRLLISLIGDTSNLILDPDLDSYYVMDSILLKLVSGQDLLGQLNAACDELIYSKKLTTESRNELVVQTSLIRTLLEDTNSPYFGLRTAMKTVNDSTPGDTLRKRLDPPLSNYIQAGNSYLDLVRKGLLDSADIRLKDEDHDKAAQSALDAAFKLWDDSIKVLDELLEKRISGFRSNAYAALFGVFLAVALTAALVVFIVRGFTRQIQAMDEQFAQFRAGNFQARAEVISNDELGKMAMTLNETVLPLVQSREERDQIQTSIIKILDEVSGVAEGDLTKDAVVTADVTGAIADSFNFMIEQLRKIIGNVQEAALQVASSANQLFATSEHLARGAEAQAEQITNTSAGIEEMAVSVQQVSENAALSAQVAQQSLTGARRGNEAVQSTIEGMDRIRDQVQETAKRIKRLGESSQEIGQIIQLIDDIADRTSILALNASIQAAMAGEAGRGFAVVAGEVERLAVRSTDATKKIASLVKSIQAETNEAVAAMDKGIQEVVEGSRRANQAGQALAEIQTVSTRLAELIQSISHASSQQARGSEALAKSMNEISQITQQTAAGTKEASASVNELARLADELRASVSQFKLPGGGPSIPAPVFPALQPKTTPRDFGPDPSARRVTMLDMRNPS